MKTRNKVQRAAAAALAALLTLTACGGTPTGKQATEIPKTQNTADISESVRPDPPAVAMLPESYKAKGELTVAMDLTAPPTTFLAEDNTTPIGVNPDIARLVAKKLGLKLKFENTAFDTIIPGIDGGRYDFTATTMASTPERLKVMDMVDYLRGGISVAVTAGKSAQSGQRHCAARTLPSRKAPPASGRICRTSRSGLAPPRARRPSTE